MFVVTDKPILRVRALFVPRDGKELQVIKLRFSYLIVVLSRDYFKCKCVDSLELDTVASFKVSKEFPAVVSYIYCLHDRETVKIAQMCVVIIAR